MNTLIDKNRNGYIWHCLICGNFTHFKNDILFRGVLLLRPLDEPLTGVVALLSGVVTTTPFSQSLVIIWLAIHTSGELEDQAIVAGTITMG